jgi:hypothetical protein
MGYIKNIIYIIYIYIIYKAHYLYYIYHTDYGTDNWINDEEEFDDGLATAQTIGLSKVQHYDDNKEEKNKAIDWLFPDTTFRASTSTTPSNKNCVLCVTNESVDNWNALIQERNLEEAVTLTSHDEFADVDDDNGYLAKLLTKNIKQELNDAASVPPHILSLKQYDTCLVLRSLKSDNIPTNARLKILRITEFSIIGQLIDDNNRVVTIPRIRFNFSMKAGRNFKIRRTQFPLRLAYAMTVNKCQGQTLLRVLLDCTTMMFSHGHLYVALSRVTSRQNIKFFCSQDNLHAYNGEIYNHDDQGGQHTFGLITEVLVKNVFYSDLLAKFLLHQHD